MTAAPASIEALRIAAGRRKKNRAADLFAVDASDAMGLIGRVLGGFQLIMERLSKRCS